MKTRFLLSGLFALMAGEPAFAQTNVVQNVVGTAPLQLNLSNVTDKCVFTGITSLALNQAIPLPCNAQGQLMVAATVEATATTTATASANPLAVAAGPGAPLNIDLNSSLFVQPTFAGTPVDSTHGLPVNCLVGCSSVAPAAPTVTASGLATNLVLLASPTGAAGGVKYYHAENATAISGYCVLYNATAAPGTGSLTPADVLAFQLLPASGFCDWTATNNPIAASIGAVVLVTSAATPFTYTTGVITASIYGLAQ